MRGIIKSGELGALKHISSNFILPKGVTAAYKPSDFDLAKGAILDIGCTFQFSYVEVIYNSDVGQLIIVI